MPTAIALVLALAPLAFAAGLLHVVIFQLRILKVLFGIVGSSAFLFLLLLLLELRLFVVGGLEGISSIARCVSGIGGISNGISRVEGVYGVRGGIDAAAAAVKSVGKVSLHSLRKLAHGAKIFTVGYDLECLGIPHQFGGDGVGISQVAECFVVLHNLIEVVGVFL